MNTNENPINVVLIYCRLHWIESLIWAERIFINVSIIYRDNNEHIIWNILQWCWMSKQKLPNIESFEWSRMGTGFMWVRFNIHKRKHISNVVWNIEMNCFLLLNRTFCVCIRTRVFNMCILYSNMRHFWYIKAF